MFICNFGFTLRKKERLSTDKKPVADREIEILQKAKRVSVFWVTETQARAVRITELIKTGKVDLSGGEYPWCNVKWKK